MTAVDSAAAQRLIDESTFVWHQRFELAPGIFMPGVNPIDELYARAGIPADLTGRSVLDIGTTNGAAAFEAERRGARRVVATDIFEPGWFGFDALSELLGSEVEFVQCSIYDCPERLGGEQFDIVLFWGVLYHLRHPLLALDKVREVAAGTVYVESAVSDHELDPAERASAIAKFYRHDELAGDPTNWFAPTVRLLGDWLASCGLKPVVLGGSPTDGATRGFATCVPTDGPPEWRIAGYERPITAQLTLG